MTCRTYPSVLRVWRKLVALAVTAACAACDARKIHLGDGREGGTCGVFLLPLICRAAHRSFVRERAKFRIEVSVS
jgi:hypothetical protein